MEKIVNHKIINFLYFIDVVIVLFNSGYYRSTINDSYIPLYMLIGITGITLIFCHDKIRKNLALYCFVALAIGVFLSIIFNFNTSNFLSGFRVFVTILCSFLLVLEIPNDKFLSYFVFLTKVLIVFSLALELFILVFDTSGLPLIKSESSSYYDLIFVTKMVNSNRSLGFFWEPGVFATIIAYSFIVELYFLNKKMNLFSLALYIIGIMLTKSTAGILLLIILLLGLFMKRNNFKKRKVLNFFAIILIGLMIIFYEDLFAFLNTINPKVFGKLVDTKIATTTTRLNSPLINLQLFFERPITGWGFTDAASLYSAHLDAQFTAQTSTSTQLLSCIGIFGIAYSLMIIIPFARKKSFPFLSFIDKVIVIVLFLLIVNKEPHIFIVITWCLFFSACKISSNDLYQSAHTRIVSEIK